MSTGSVSLLLGKYPPSSTQKSLVKVLQWLSRAAPSLPPTLVIHDTATEFYANYPAPPEESLDDIVPPLPSFDDTATAHFLPAGLPGITVKHVCKCYQNTVRGFLMCIEVYLSKPNRMYHSRHGPNIVTTISTNLWGPREGVVFSLGVWCQTIKLFHSPNKEIHPC